jgi:hypothetical protein
LSRLRIGVLLAAISPFVCTPVARAETFSVEAVKAAFLYRFASYVEWPADAPASPLVVGVAGDEGVARQLEALMPRMAANRRTVELRRVTRASELGGVHILYIGPRALARTRALRSVALDRPILLVTDDAHGLDAGAVINFIAVDRNVRFEISVIAADRARLRIDSALLSVAARVERRPAAIRSVEEGRP